MNKPIGKKILDRFIEQALKKLKGDWIIIGGSAAILLDISSRATMDIDIAGPADATNSDMLALMEIAESLGLPPEVINPIGAFFLRKIPDWEKHLVLIEKNSRARIFRPDGTLFLLLKLARMSEPDLEDSIAMVRYCAKRHEGLERERVLSELRALEKHADPQQRKRYKKLLRRLGK
jgi:hypothetical protein